MKSYQFVKVDASSLNTTVIRKSCITSNTSKFLCVVKLNKIFKITKSKYPHSYLTCPSWGELNLHSSNFQVKSMRNVTLQDLIPSFNRKLPPIHLIEFLYSILVVPHTTIPVKLQFCCRLSHSTLCMKSISKIREEDANQSSV